MKSHKIKSNIQVVIKNVFAIFAIFLISAFLHYPLLLNANIILNFDEQIQASEILRLMNGEAFFFYFDYARYHGILHGFLAIPLFWLLGVSATVYKLTAILYYALYVWTTYLLAKYINKKVAFIVLLLMLVPSPAMSFNATHNFQNAIIVGLGNLMLLFYFKTKSSKDDIPWVFGLFFILGLSIYEYTYAIIYFATIVTMFVLSHPLWIEVRSKISFGKIIHSFKGSGNKFDAGLKVLDSIIFLMLMATFFAYIWGGFAIDIFHISVFQIHKFHKAGLQVLVLIVIRLVISRKFLMQYKEGILSLIKSVESQQWKRVKYGLLGFSIGISPRIFSIIQGNTSKGGKGFDMNIDPITMLNHLWVMITVRIADVLGIREPISKVFTSGLYEGTPSVFNIILSISILVLVLFSCYKFLYWKWNSLRDVFLLKKIEYDPILVIVLVCFFTIFANVLTENGPASIRYAYPCFGVILIWVAYLFEKIKKKSLIVFFILISAWIGFQGQNNYQFYKESGMIAGFTPIKKPFHLKPALEFLKTKNTEFVYTNLYTALQAQLIGGNDILITTKNSTTWGKLSREKPVSPDGFAIIYNAISGSVDLNSYSAAYLYKFSKPSKKIEAERSNANKNNWYRNFLEENKILYESKKIGPHYVLWNIQANKEQFKNMIQ
jgi:hypothetical protein